VVVLGKVRGTIGTCGHPPESSLTGDVIAQRISIMDGAFFTGSIDMSKSGRLSARR